MVQGAQAEGGREAAAERHQPGRPRRPGAALVRPDSPGPQTDSTRLVTLLLLGTSLVPPVQGVSLGHHDLSHHGQDPNKIEQLRKVELEELTTLRDFLKKLKETKEEGSTLLD